MIGKLLPAFMGTLLIIAGIVQVFIQVHRTPSEHRGQLPQGVEVGLFTWKGQSAYPGITMIFIGAFLLSIAGIVEIFTR